MVNYKRKIEAHIRKREAEKAQFQKDKNIVGVVQTEILLMELRELLAD